ncbi:MAG: hypothetical protein V3U52_05920 [Thermoplasmata archaeon]
MPEDRPTAAFVLALIGAIFYTIGGVVMAVVVATAGALGFLVFLGSGPFPALGLLLTALAIVFIVLAFLGVYWLYTGNKTQVVYGGVLTLVIAIIAFPTIWGFFIGSLLGFIGGILGLVWKPMPSPVAPIAQPAAPVAPAPAAPASEPPSAPAEEPAKEEPVEE